MTLQDIKLNPCKACGSEAVLTAGAYDYGWGYGISIGCTKRCRPSGLSPTWIHVPLYVPDDWEDNPEYCRDKHYPDWKKLMEVTVKGLISWWNNWATADLQPIDEGEANA